MPKTKRSFDADMHFSAHACEVDTNEIKVKEPDYYSANIKREQTMIEELKAMFTFGCAKKKEKKTTLPPVTQKIDPPAMKAPKADPSVYCSKLLFVDYDGCRMFFNEDSVFEWRCNDTYRFAIAMHTNCLRIACAYQNPITKAVYEATPYLIIGDHNRVVRYSSGIHSYLFVELTRENFDKLVGAK